MIKAIKNILFPKRWILVSVFNQKFNSDKMNERQIEIMRKYSTCSADSDFRVCKLTGNHFYIITNDRKKLKTVETEFKRELIFETLQGNITHPMYGYLFFKMDEHEQRIKQLLEATKNKETEK